MLEKKARIRTSKEYKNVFALGKRFSGRFLIMYYIKRKPGENRFGFITNKKIGKAVIRNKVKRRLRAIVRKYRKAVTAKYDVILVARANIGKGSFQEIEKDYVTIMKKAGLFAKNIDTDN